MSADESGRKIGSAGYSGTPLARKLGIQAGMRVHVRHSPVDYPALVAPLPEGVVFSERVSDRDGLVHIFHRERIALDADLRQLRPCIAQDTAIWVSWPKKASNLATDISEDGIRDLALPLGYVDVKVCAVDGTWSALKLMIRKALRKPSS